MIARKESIHNAFAAIAQVIFETIENAERTTFFMNQLGQNKPLQRGLKIILALVLVGAISFLTLDATQWHRFFFKPKIIIVNGTEVIVNDKLKRNEYIESDFATDKNGRMSYTKGVTCTGIDVSSHQGEINWRKVSKSGIRFAILRAGLRGYTKGGIFADETFQTNAENAVKNGIEIGCYFFSQATSVEEAEQEAEFVLEQVKGLKLSYPIVYDWERIAPEEAGEEGARTDGMEAELVTDCALAFCAKIEAAGYQSAVYFNNDVGYFYYDISRLQEKTIWFAAYQQPYPNYYYHIDWWQYTDTGTVDGITGNVDLNIIPIEGDPADHHQLGGDSSDGSESGSMS